MTTQAPLTWAATGRRKNAVARVILQPGNGRITVNKRTVEDYFPVAKLRLILAEPLEAVNSVGQFDLAVTVRGGGIAGQAGALRHGLARALEKWNPEFRSALKQGGFLSRDSRIKERKKYGQKGARARFQFSKR